MILKLIYILVSIIMETNTNKLYIYDHEYKIINLSNKDFLISLKGEDLKRICSHLNLSISGNKDILSNNIISFFSNIRDRSYLNTLDEEELEDIIYCLSLPSPGSKIDLINRIHKIVYNPLLLPLNDIKDVGESSLNDDNNVPINDIKIEIKNVDNSLLNSIDDIKIVDDLNNVLRKDSDGYVYIIKSKSWKKRVKIGRTKNRQNCEQTYNYLFRRYKTALGKDMKIYLFKTDDQFKSETAVHTKLDRYRCDGSEHFDISLKRAIKTCKKLVNLDMIDIN
jgi:hypothetical protein